MKGCVCLREILCICLRRALLMLVYVCTLHSESMRLYLCLCVFVCVLVDSDLGGLGARETLLSHFGKVLLSACDVTYPKQETVGRVAGSVVKGHVTIGVSVDIYP